MQLCKLGVKPRGLSYLSQIFNGLEVIRDANFALEGSMDLIPRSRVRRSTDLYCTKPKARYRGLQWGVVCAGSPIRSGFLGRIRRALLNFRYGLTEIARDITAYP